MATRTQERPLDKRETSNLIGSDKVEGRTLHDNTMEVEMKMVKTLLLGSAAGLVAVAGAQAADMPVKAAPVQYVRSAACTGMGSTTFPAPTPA